MKQSYSSEVNSRSASYKIPRLLWQPKVRRRVHTSPPTRQMKAVRVLKPQVFKIHFSIMPHLRLCIAGLFILFHKLSISGRKSGV
jgi:hypothetical protein